MVSKRVKISTIVENQLPEYVREEFPLVSEFLKQYYISLESSGNSYDIINNIDQYVKIDNLSNLINETTLTANVEFFDTTINVVSTAGFADSFGLLKIGNEIISYESKTDTTFENCYRAFSGVTSYNNDKNIDQLIFSQSSQEQHSTGDIVENLNSLLLIAFFNKLKKQISPGFEDRDFFVDLNESIFVKYARDFYTSKGTVQSFKILFKALYGADVEVILPRDYLFEPSDANYRIVKKVAVELISGNIQDLKNKTIYQDTSIIAEASQGVVNNVEELIVDNQIVESYFLNPVSEKSAFSPLKKYYILDIDYDYNKDIDSVGSTKGDFTIHPKTKLTTDVITNQPYLDVDSTVGFPESGELIIDLPDQSTVTIYYTDKTLNQFLGCSGINQDINSGEEVKYNDYVYAFDSDENEIRLRITGVVSEVVVPNDVNLLEKGDAIRLKNLGKTTDDIRLNNWIFNIKSYYDVFSLNLIDPSIFTYELETYDDHDFKLGDGIFLLSRENEQTPLGAVVSILDKKRITISGQGELDLSNNYKIYRNISKVNFKDYSNISFYNANVSNTYYDEKDKSIYVTSPSLPNYNNEELKLFDKKISGSVLTNDTIQFTSRHTFISGNLVILKINNDETQIVGYAEKISNTRIKLTKNKESILTQSYVDFSGYVGFNVTAEYFSFNELNIETQRYDSKFVEPQKIIRKITDPISYDNDEINTESGPIGIFINGVEIFNYKSTDSFFYGPIDTIDVLAGGSGYDVINPPVLEITDEVGSGVSAHVFVTGKLDRIDILDSGFNYVEQPTIQITGGNGRGTEAIVSLISYTHSSTVSVTASSISSINNTITFTSPHKFSDFEQVIYNTNNNQAISGLSTNSTYYLKAVGINTIKLYSSFENALVGTAISVSALSNLGVHEFRSLEQKRKIGSINIVNSGSNYTNKQLIASPEDVNIYSDTINIKDHQFKSGEIITYVSTGSSIGGLVNGNYYVESVDKDSFRLYEISNSNSKTFFLDSNQYINLTGVGSSNHIFKYPDIEVIVSGKYEVPTGNNEEDFRAKIQPIFRGSISGTFVTNPGNQYGSDQIVDFSKQPNFNLISGANAEIAVVVTDGTIISAFAVNNGENYNSPPNLTVNGSGSGAILIPIIENGSIKDVAILSGGSGYNQNSTSVTVTPAGLGAKFIANTREWIVNLVFKEIQDYTNESTLDDGYISPSRNNLGLQYGHLYGSRKLRQNVITQLFEGSIIKYVPDLIYDVETGIEIDSNAHSPILGWSYDGHPIYGPYGYTNTNGTGGIKQLKSGYILSPDSNRPSDGYPAGYFVNDYIFNDSGDLDIHNGRFCVTPEYPNGIYAYFLTFEDVVSNDFDNYKLPAFPYVIGNSYKSIPISFNYSTSSSTNKINLNTTGWLRNTLPYNISNIKSGYEYFLNSKKLLIDSRVASIFDGKVSDIEILSAGLNYRVGDTIKFDNTGTSGNSVAAFISDIKGVGVSTISCAQTSYSNVEFLKLNGNNYVGYFTDTHNLGIYDIASVSFTSEEFQDIKISYSQNEFKLSSGISTGDSTGICTYISVSGSFNPNIIRVNDYYVIQNEIIKIIEVDSESSRLRILRGQKGTSGLSSYNSGTVLSELSQKIFTSLNVRNNYIEKVNSEIYFDPIESLGIGTLTGPGITNILNISNPGAGKTIIAIPTGTIYLKNHNLETGDKIFYKNNGGTSISVSNDGINSLPLTDLIQLYVAKVSKDLIGVSTCPIGIGSEGNYIGIGLTQANILYLTGIGTGSYHSFVTNYDNILTGEIFKNTVTVSTGSSHGLKLLDPVNIQLNLTNITKTIVIKYNENNRRLVVDPTEIGSVDVVKDILTIENHNFQLGDKVIYESVTPIGGLQVDGIYYVIPLSSDQFRLSTSRYNSESNIFVDLTSSGTGEISKINPNIIVRQYQKIKFDLSDESLSYLSGGLTKKSSFNFDIFTNAQLTDNLYETDNDIIKIEKFGQIGVDSNANVLVTVNENTPKKIYYQLLPLLIESNPESKKEILIDSEQNSYNEINIIESEYNGNHTIIDVSDYTFSYNITEIPESNGYTSFDGELFYDTKSKNISGPISKIKISNNGDGYKLLPRIDSIVTQDGQFATLFPASDDIGKLNSAVFDTIGYDYSADLTLRPSIIPPVILKINAFSIFEKIEVIEPGFSYNIDSTLIVLDGSTGERVTDVNLIYDVEDSVVNIIENTKGISNFEPTIFPINNPNGIEINSISYDELLNTIKIILAPSFSSEEDFPFAVGTKFLIEGLVINETDDEDIKNYNSRDFNFKLFEVIESDGKIGGQNAEVTYSALGLLNPGESFGTINSFLSEGKIVPQSYFPTFKSTLIKGDFVVGETITSGEFSGIVQKWNKDSGYLKIITNDSFILGQRITAQNTKTKGTIIDIIDTEGTYKIASSSIINNGWRDERGFISNSLQRLHDSDYYQYFSYSLKSEIDFDKWVSPVSNLNHTAGFKKFSDLSVVSIPLNSGISTDQGSGDFQSTSNIFSSVDLDCVYNFDLASENSLLVSGQTVSTRVIFNSRLINDYIESIGNRVLTIDDISSQFDSTSRDELFENVVTYSIDDYRYSKFFVTLTNRLFAENSSFNIITVLHDNTVAYLNQYGKIFSVDDTGVFDVGINTTSNEISLRFYPTDPLSDSFNLINVTSFNIKDILTGISTNSLGDSVFLSSYSAEIPQGTSTATEIVSIATSCRSAKLLTLINKPEESEYESVELSIIHDDTNVYIAEYGNLQSSMSGSISGVGTYDAYISGSNIIVEYTPNVSTSSTYIANSFVVGLTTSEYTSTDTVLLNESCIKSTVTSVLSTPFPSQVSISTFTSNNVSSAYLLLSIEDTTNNEFKLSEVVIHTNELSGITDQVEYGIVQTGISSIGIITSFTEQIGNDLVTSVFFTPEANTSYQITVFNSAFVKNTQISEYFIGTSNYIKNDYGFYDAAFDDRKSDFNLTYQGDDIFVRSFNAQDSSVVDISNDTINIPNHFFVTGEEILYVIGENDSPIGIATTTIPGIGTTDILPDKVYVVKDDTLKIRVSGTATDALSAAPKFLDITSVGIGTHLFKSQQQNTKCLIAIDNVIQTPIVSLANTTFLLNDIDIFDSVISIDFSTKFKSGDYISLDSEIMKILVVGYGNSTNDILVKRKLLGTNISPHTAGTLVQQIQGEYNIIDNTLNFVEPPQGEIPDENPSIPDEIDYAGIKTSSTFSGRVFLRSGIEDTDLIPYYDNNIFDSVADQFNGINNIFVLTTNGDNVTGISTNNTITLVRNIFQVPSVLNAENAEVLEGNYFIQENSGITSITFTGDSSLTPYDINNSGVPKGGIIISVGSTEGFGYQPLVSAGGTAIVSAAGTIQSVSIGNSGSGYRSGIQTVNVGVQTSDVIDTNIDYIGIATISDGHIIGVAITNSGVGYTAYETIYSTEISSFVGSGSTVFFVSDTYDIDTNYFVSVGTGITNVSIVGVSTTSFTISNSDTSLSTFSVGTEVLFKIYNPPRVVFDAPLSYSNLPLFYSQDSQSGIGTQARVDLIVSQDSSILEFEFTNLGYAYEIGDILTVSIGGTTGIPTTGQTFREFQLTVTDVYTDTFASWHLGQFEVINPIDDLIDGQRTIFPIRFNNIQTSLEPRPGSNIDIDATLLIFVDDVLQNPNVSYIFNGGSLIEFTEPLAVGSKTKLLFYRGTPDIDTQLIDILETVKVGDTLKLISDDSELTQNNRIVQEIISSDVARTNIYTGDGITDGTILRNVIWCKQKNDIFVTSVGIGQSTNNYQQSKARETDSIRIHPVAHVIKKISVTDEEIFVDNVRTIFDSSDEYSSQPKFLKQVNIISQDSVVSCSATVIVNSSGNIDSIVIDDNGSGYTFTPEVYISSPISSGTTAILTANMNGDVVQSISIGNSGSGYNSTNPPSVLIEPPETLYENVLSVEYDGDFGIITGIGTTDVGISTGVVFDFYIPINSYLRDSEYVGTAITVSGIQTGYYFVVKNSITGNGLESLDEFDQIIGIGNTFIDNVYRVHDYSIIQETVPGIGVTSVTRVVVNVSDNSQISAGQTYCYGEFSWGRLWNIARRSPQEFEIYNNGLIGIETSPIVQRYYPLRFSNYNPN